MACYPRCRDRAAAFRRFGMKRVFSKYIAVLILAAVAAGLTGFASAAAAAEEAAEPEQGYIDPLPDAPADSVPAAQEEYAGPEEGQQSAAGEEEPAWDAGTPEETGAGDPAASPEEGAIDPESAAGQEGAIDPEDGAGAAGGDEAAEGTHPAEEPAVVTPPGGWSLPRDDDPIPSKEIPADDPRFLDKSWDEVVANFFSERRIDPSCAGIAYYNTVTGEEYDLNGETYFYAASLYKVPLNMYLSELVYKGELGYTDEIFGISYEALQRSSVQFSSNISSDLLQQYIGSQQQYLDAVRPFYADEDEDFNTRHTYYNTFTAKQFLHALKMLYAEPERYPGVLDRMRDANPGAYFKLKERRFVIAQKYGYYYDDDLGAINAIGVIYTDEPILLVMMSKYLPGGSYTLGEFCVEMCDYAQYWAGVRDRERAETASTVLDEAIPLLESRENAVLAAYAETNPEPTPEPESASAPGGGSSGAAELAAGQERLVDAELAAAAAAAELEASNARRKTVILAGAALLALILVAVLIRAGRARTRVRMLPLAILPALLALGIGCAMPASADAATLRDPDAEETAAVSVLLTDSRGRVWRIAPTEAPLPERVLAMRNGCPPFVGLWTVRVCGAEFANTATEAVFPAAGLTEEELTAALAWLPNLRCADLCATDCSNETAEALMARFPGLRVVWTVRAAAFRVRSDAQCFSTQQNLYRTHLYTDAELAPIFRYCTGLRALDVGHNALRDLSPIGLLTDLRVLIIADNPVRDLSPLQNLTGLEYLELFLCNDVTDFSPLGSLTKLVDLNAGFCRGLDDLDFLDGLDALELAWFPAKHQRIPAPAREQAAQAHPQTRFVFYNGTNSSTADGWRTTERNIAIRTAFRNWREVTAFSSWDAVEYRAGAKLSYCVAEYV